MDAWTPWCMLIEYLTEWSVNLRELEEEWMLDSMVHVDRISNRVVREFEGIRRRMDAGLHGAC